MNDGVNESLQKTQEMILKHHGGDGDHARDMISSTYARRHAEDFWQFWDAVVALHYAEGDGVVDLGAGIGQFVEDCAKRYPASKVVGIEAAPYMLEKALDLPSNAELVVDDLHLPQAPIAKNSVAMVMANMVVHELTQPIKMFKAAFEWLKLGGRLCVVDIVRQPLADYLNHRYADTSVADEATTVEDLDDAFEHFLEHNRYHPEDILFMLQAVGFELVEELRYRNDRFVRLVVEKR